MNISEYIKICFIKKNMKMVDVATATNQSKANLSQKINRNDMKISELEKISNALDCDLQVLFIDRKTNQPIY